MAREAQRSGDKKMRGEKKLFNEFTLVKKSGIKGIKLFQFYYDCCKLGECLCRVHTTRPSEINFHLMASQKKTSLTHLSLSRAQSCALKIIYFFSFSFLIQFFREGGSVSPGMESFCYFLSKIIIAFLLLIDLLLCFIIDFWLYNFDDTYDDNWVVLWENGITPS